MPTRRGMTPTSWRRRKAPTTQPMPPHGEGDWPVDVSLDLALPREETPPTPTAARNPCRWPRRLPNPSRCPGPTRRRCPSRPSPPRRHRRLPAPAVAPAPKPHAATGLRPPPPRPHDATPPRNQHRSAHATPRPTRRPRWNRRHSTSRTSMRTPKRRGSPCAMPDWRATARTPPCRPAAASSRRCSSIRPRVAATRTAARATATAAPPAASSSSPFGAWPPAAGGACAAARAARPAAVAQRSRCRADASHAGARAALAGAARPGALHGGAADRRVVGGTLDHRQPARRDAATAARRDAGGARAKPAPAPHRLPRHRLPRRRRLPRPTGARRSPPAAPAARAWALLGHPSRARGALVDELIRLVATPAGVALRAPAANEPPALTLMRTDALIAARAANTPLQVVAPLYNEQVQVLVRTDARWDYVREIRGLRLNIGPRRRRTGAHRARAVPAAVRHRAARRAGQRTRPRRRAERAAAARQPDRRDRGGVGVADRIPIATRCAARWCAS